MMRIVPGVARVSCIHWCLWAGLGCASGSGNVRPPSADEAPAHTNAPSQGNDPDAVSGEVTDRQLERLERIVADDDGTEHPHVHLILADAYLSRAFGAHALGVELGGQRYEAAEGQRADLDRRYAEATERRGRWLAKAIASFEAVLAESGPASRKLRPTARLGLADALGSAERPQERDEVLAALVRDDPKHPFAGHALVQLGDRAFSNADLTEARVLYERAVAVAGLGDRLYAEYKLGWVALNLGDAVLALETWVGVVRDGRLSSEHRVLAGAAAKDCVVAFASVGVPAQARAFFRRLHPELAPALLMQLAAVYRDEDRDADALIVLGAGAPASDAR